MRKQLADGDPVAARNPGDEFGNMVVEAQLALVLKQEQGHGG